MNTEQATFEPLPEAIQHATERLFFFWGQLGRPRMTLVPRGRQRRWQFTERLTVGDHEQVAEYHIRLARSAINRYRRRRSWNSAETAANHIVRARFHRAAALLLMSVTPSEAMLPFSRPEESA